MFQRVDSAETHNYITDGDSPVAPALSDGSAVYTPGLSENRSGTSAYYHPDALGSTRDITNSSQSVTDTRRFDAFGMLAETAGSNPTPFGFAGAAQYQTDSDSGLMLLGHRYYDNTTGRFISRDPAYAGTNWYDYCGNNPLSQIDPSGQNWQHVAIGCIIGGIVVVGIVASGGTLGLALLGGGVAGFIGGAGSGALGGSQDPIGDGCQAGLTVVSVGGELLGGFGGPGEGEGEGSGPTVNYPPNKGFAPPGPYDNELPVGTTITRYGGEGGVNVTEPGEGNGPPGISLPPNNPGWNTPGNNYKVLKPIQVKSGHAMPWNWPGYPGAPPGTGGGVQHELPEPIEKLIESGHLGRLF